MTGKIGMKWQDKIKERVDLNISISGCTNKRILKIIEKENGNDKTKKLTTGYKRAYIVRKAIAEYLDKEGV